MPVQLRSMRRRTFVGSGLFGAAAWATRPWAAAAQQEQEGNEGDGVVESDLVILLSDTHLDGNRSTVVRGVNMAKQLQQVVQRVVEGPTPAAVMVNGDLARDSGRPGDYKLLGELLIGPILGQTATLGMTLGNHDQRQRFLASLTDQPIESPVVDKHVLLIEQGKTDWYLLDSLRDTDEVPGELGEAQLTWLAQSLDERRGRAALVMVHHQPEDPENPDDEGFGLEDTEALMDVLRGRRQVKALFHGHRHAWTVRREKAMHIVGLPATSYVFDDTQRPGYVEARVGADHIELTRRGVTEDDPHEGQVLRLNYR